MARSPYRPPSFEEAVRRDTDLRPVASPVDTYVTPPQVQQDTGLMELARGLSTLDSSLAEFTRQREAQRSEEDKVRAEADFHRNNRVGYAEAVAQGLIPPTASRVYQQGWKEAEGRVAGARLEQKFLSDYEAWAGKDDPDPTKFDQFFSGWLKQNLGDTQDPATLRGLLPRLNQLSASALARNNADRANGLTRRKNNAFAAESGIAVDEAHRDGFVERKGTDYESMFKRLEDTRARHISEGSNPDDLDKLLADSIAAKALEKRDPNILKFFDRKVPGKDYAYKDTPYGRELRAKTIDSLESMGRKAIAEEEKRRVEADKKEYEEITRRAIEHLAKDPDAPLPDDLLKAGIMRNEEFRLKVIGWRETIRKGQSSTNPEALRDLNWKLIQSGGKGTERILQEGIETGILNNKEDLVSAYNLAEKMRKEGGKVEAIRTSDASKNIRATIKQRTLSRDDMSNPFAPDGLSDAGLAATYDYDRLVSEWAIANPNASALERDEAAAKIGKSILDRITRADGGTGQEEYRRDPAQGFSNPYVNQQPPAAPPAPPPAQAPQAQPQQRTQAPQPQAPSQGAQPAGQMSLEAGNWYFSLPPQARANAESLAQRTGRPLAEIVNEGYRRLNTQQQQQAAPRPETPPAQPMSNTVDGTGGEPQVTPASLNPQQQFDQVIDEETDPTPERLASFSKAITDILSNPDPNPRKGKFTMAALRDDPMAASILDFVAGPESGGNYNAVFGNAKSKRDLSKLTVGQVLAEQQAQRRAGAKSTAIGRYQFIFKTLNGLVRDLGIDPNENFTPQLQDRLAIELLRRRGYDQYRAGKMSMEQFALNLAKEWASLPDPRTGRSVYAGDGLNKSLVDVEGVFKTLSRGRPAKQPKTPETKA